MNKLLAICAIAAGIGLAGLTSSANAGHCYGTGYGYRGHGGYGGYGYGAYPVYYRTNPGYGYRGSVYAPGRIYGGHHHHGGYYGHPGYGYGPGGGFAIQTRGFGLYVR